MAEEQTLEIHTVTGKNGNEYKNIVLKPTKKQRQAGVEGLKPEHYIIVEKVFPEGFENITVFDGKENKSYSCKVKYGDDEVSFWLNERQHEAYKVLGGEGSQVKITAGLKENTKTGAFYVDFTFDPIN